MIRWFVLLMVSALTVSAGNLPETSADPIAVSPCGRYRLRLVMTSREPSPWDPATAAVSLRFKMEYRPSGTGPFVSERPADVYLEKMDPFVSARCAGGQPVDGSRHFGWTDWRSLELFIRNMEIGDPENTLEQLTLAVTLVRVTSWDILTFTDLGCSGNEPLPCGPFVLEVTGEDTRAIVRCIRNPDAQGEKKESEKLACLHFLDPVYGIEHTAIRDAKGRELRYMSGWSTAGRVSAGNFLIEPDRQGEAAGIIEKGDPVRYPVTVDVRLPKTWETEIIEFTFAELPFH